MNIDKWITNTQLEIWKSNKQSKKLKQSLYRWKGLSTTLIYHTKILNKEIKINNIELLQNTKKIRKNWKCKFIQLNYQKNVL